MSMDGRRTDVGTKLIYHFFLKEKAGITKILMTIGSLMQVNGFCRMLPLEHSSKFLPALSDNWP